MKSYDDLQRFKEKTQTNHIEFKDMSEQSLNSDTTNWAIIKQLLNDEAGSVLEKSQRIDVAAPQPVDPSAFASPPAPAATAPANPAVQSFATPAAASGSSLLDSISSSLKPAADTPAPAIAAPVPAAAPQHPGLTPAETAAEAAALRPAPVAQIASAAGGSLFDQLAAQTPPAVAPAAASASAPAAPLNAPPLQQASDRVQTINTAREPENSAPGWRAQPQSSPPTDIRYKQLFGSTGGAARAVSKESLLQPLLEKIASCR